jgi:hypothetical protein
MKQALAILEKLEREQFFGRVEFQFRAGQIELVRKEETIKIKGNTHDERNTW